MSHRHRRRNRNWSVHVRRGHRALQNRTIAKRITARTCRLPHEHRRGLEAIIWNTARWVRRCCRVRMHPWLHFHLSNKREREKARAFSIIDAADYSNNRTHTHSHTQGKAKEEQRKKKTRKEKLPEKKIIKIKFREKSVTQYITKIRNK